MQQSLRSLHGELKKLGLSLNKCKMFALNVKSTISTCVVKLGETSFKSERELSYLGGACSYLKNSTLCWKTKEPQVKATQRLGKAKSQHLQLNTITTTSMSKIVSLPRYACAFNGMEEKVLKHRWT